VHDVEITPNGTTGVVSGNGLWVVYRLSDGVERGRHISSTASPLPFMRLRATPYAWMTTDSLVVTDTRALIVGSTGGATHCPPQTPPTLDTSHWSMALVNLRTLEDHVYNDSTTPTGTPSRAHDVAITPNRATAFVTTRTGTYHVNIGNATWPPPAPVAYLDSTDPLRFVGNSAFVTNSIACTNTRAVAIGRNTTSGIPQIVVIDANAPPGPTAILSTISMYQSPVPNPAGKFSEVVPTDVVIDPSETYAIVRSFESNSSYAGPMPLPSGWTAISYGRISIVRLTDGQLVWEQDHQGAGSAYQPFGAGWGLNHVAASADYAITGGENGVGQGFVSAGWVQIVKLR
jgi:hypothetical protein